MSIKKCRIANVIALGLSMLLSASNAWSYSCVGPVVGVSIGPVGIVVAESIPGGSWIYICQIGDTYNSVGPEQCKAIYTLLLTAQATGKQVRMWFNDDGTTCTNHPAWTPLSGWYFGPELMP